MRRSKANRNLLEMVPVRNREWELDEQGNTIIICPRYGRMGTRLAGSFRMKTKIRVTLTDEYGSAVWDLCDGGKTVREIGIELKDKFGEEVEPLYPRLSKFLQIMSGNGLIRFREENSTQ